MQDLLYQVPGGMDGLITLYYNVSIMDSRILLYLIFSHVYIVLPSSSVVLLYFFLLTPASDDSIY